MAKHIVHHVNNVTSHIQIIFDMYEEQQIVSDLSTIISWKATLITDSQGSITEGEQKVVGVWINDETFTSRANIIIGKNQTKEIFSGSTEVKHRATGYMGVIWKYNIIVDITDGDKIIGYAEADGHVDLTPILKPSTLTLAQNFWNVGETVSFTVRGQNPSYLHDITLITTDLSIPIRTNAEWGTIYYTVPVTLTPYFPAGQRYITAYLYITTKDSTGSYIGENRYSINIYLADTAAPLIYMNVVDTNETTKALTGDNTKLVKYWSNARLDLSLVAQAGESIRSWYVETGDGQRIYDQNPIEYLNIQNSRFEVHAFDTRDLEGIKVEQIPMVEYFRPTCNISNVSLDSSGTLRFKISGKFFNNTFGLVNNSIVCAYSYYSKSYTVNQSVFLDSSNITTDGDYYEIEVVAPDLDYRDTYYIRAQVGDRLELVATDIYTVSALPVFDWSESDFNFNVPVTIQGKQVATVDGGTGDAEFDKWLPFSDSSSWFFYKKYSDGTAEIWGTRTVFTAVSNAWGSMYTSGALSETNLTYPFSFLYEPSVVVQITPYYTGGILMAAGGSGQTANFNQTGIFEIARGSSIANSPFQISYYIKGIWKA